MPEDTGTQAGVNESFDANGRLEVTEDVFVDEAEVSSAPNEESSDEQSDPISDEQAEPEQNGEGEATAPVVETAPVAPKLLAGKFQTEQELKNEFIRLGGNPANYDTPEKLEQAYEVRASEQSRYQQEQQELQRIERLADQPAPKAPKEIAKEVFQNIDFSKASNPQELAEMIVEGVQAVFENLPQQEGLNPQDVAKQVAEVQQKQEALSSIETKVPRLKTDQNFRKQFALHVANGKDGQAYPRTTEGLDMAMKDFLTGAQSIVEEAGKMITQQTDAKQTATTTNSPASGNAQSASTQRVSPEEDIMGGILEAHKERQYRHGMF